VIDTVGQLLAAAQAARSRQDAAEELRLLERALAAAPNDPRVLNARGMRALSDNEAGRARELFEAAAAIDPNEPSLWMNAATACRHLDDSPGEEASLNRALDLDRRHFMALLRVAQLHERLGRSVEAAQAWANLVSLARTIPDPPQGIVDALRHGEAYLAEHNRELGARLYDDLGAELAAERRFKACIDHMLGRRAIYRNECAGIHYPFLPADEFFERALFPWLPDLEARTDTVRAEALALLKEGGEAIRPYVRQDKGTPANKWTRLDNSLDWSACFLWDHGERNEAVCARCPETAAAIAAVPQNRLPGKAPSAFFSILRPGAHIPAHTGVTNTRAIVHLPLVVPTGCRFRVGGELREWREGEAFVFDDTIEHEAWNDGAEPRIVLIFDVWNPHLSATERQLVSRLFELTGSSAAAGA
jgi:aspartate beta-hydroxylase